MIDKMTRARKLCFGILVLVLLVLPVLPAPVRLPEYWLSLLNEIGLSATVAVGLVLLTGIGGMTSFGQAAFVGIGAYTTAYLTTQYAVSPWLALLASVALTAVFALFLGVITMRLSGHFLPLGTIAWGLSLFFLFGNLEFLGKYDGINGIPALSLFGWSLESNRHLYYLIWLVLLLSVFSVKNLLASRLGRAIRALRGGGVMAEAMGVDTAWLKVLIFVHAAVLASLSGFLYAHLQRSINPTPFNLNHGIEYLFMAVVGGVSHVWGALLGAAILTLSQDWLQTLLPKLLGSDGNYEIVVFGIAMVLLLQYARDGVWPYAARLFSPRGRNVSRETHAEDAVLADAAPALPVRVQPAAGTPLLEVEALRKTFGGLVAVNDVSFDVKAGEIIGLIGPNGAGKSTTFNLITGVAQASQGCVRFQGQRIDALSSREIARRGVGRTFQHVRLMPDMTVLENVAIGAHPRGHSGVIASLFRLNRREEQRLMAEAARQLTRVGLREVMYLPAGSLALGQQRVVEIARALAADPYLLLLDEPAAGLRYQEKQALAELLKRLRAEGLSVLLVEHDMDFVMNLTDRLVVLKFGTRIAEGTPEMIQKDPAVLEAYLGVADELETAGVQPATGDAQ
jgi:branched-chain amino acid transport system permease protein